MTHLHIVSFNVPWPADYGGVIDVYNRIRFLSEEGVKIHLHCYTYGREESPVLADLCEEVHYYRRATGMGSQLNRRPYIVASRRSEELIARLQQAGTIRELTVQPQNIDRLVAAMYREMDL